MNMKIDHMLTEMPQIINNIDWHELNKIASNKQSYSKLLDLSNKRLIKKLTKDAFVYQQGCMFFCLDNSSKKVTYYMTFNVGASKTIGHFVYQSLVWVDDTVMYTKHLASNMFWYELFTNYESIITNSEQTWDGKRFWLNRIRDAFGNGLNVYLYDFKLQELTKMNSLSEFSDVHDLGEIWDNQPIFKSKRMVISSLDLPLSGIER